MRQGKIKVKVTENSFGHVLVVPVLEIDKQYVSDSNWYDGSSDMYLQSDYEIVDFLTMYPKARFRVRKSGYNDQYHIGRLYYEVNDGAQFYIDEWEFRHMVGGQID